jgi:hypothetical protein
MTAKQNLLSALMGTLASFLDEEFDAPLLAVICVEGENGAVILAHGSLNVPPAAQEAAWLFVDAMSVANCSQDRVEGPK